MSIDSESKALFKNLLKYPIPRCPERYPKKTDGGITEIHDMIYSNFMLLVPNIDIGYHKQTYSSNQLRDWVAKSRAYSNEINYIFQNKCGKMIKELDAAEQQKKKCMELDMANIDKLPEDSIKIIYSYLTPETKIQFLLAKYNNLFDDLLKLKVINMKNYFDQIYKNYYKNVMNKTYSNHFGEIQCIPRKYEIRTSFENKNKFKEKIQTMISTYRGVVPTNKTIYTYFQTLAYKMILSIIYVLYYKYGFNKEKTVKPRKPRTKKT